VLDVPVLDDRLRAVIDLSSDYYWEQDSDHRITVMYHRAGGACAAQLKHFIGKPRWETGGTPVDSDWDRYRAMLDAHEPFDDFCISAPDEAGKPVLLSISGFPMHDANGQFAGYRGITTDVTEVRDGARLRSLERRITNVLLSADDTDEAMTDAIRAVCESEGWESGHYWALRPDGQSMMVQVSWTIEAKAQTTDSGNVQKIAIEKGTGLVGAVWDKGEPIWVPNLVADQRVYQKRLMEKNGWNSGFLFPVFSGSNLIGVLSFYAPYISEPNSRLLQIIRALGLQIGNYYERAVAAEKLRESEERYASTIELAAVGIAHVAMTASSCMSTGSFARCSAIRKKNC
jgi:PAS domain-containing protein